LHTLRWNCRRTIHHPMLRLETDMHVAAVRRISADTAGRFILTCSDDKIARLWDAENGNLLKIFRVPAQAGGEGKLSSIIPTQPCI
jgi:WD40 repeat protein